MSLIIKRSAPGGCEYLVPDETHDFRECGEPARFISGNRLRYCKLHAQFVEDSCRRKKVPVNLKPFP